MEGCFYQPRHECGYTSQHSWHTWHTAGMWWRGHIDVDYADLFRLLRWLDGWRESKKEQLMGRFPLRGARERERKEGGGQTDAATLWLIQNMVPSSCCPICTGGLYRAGSWALWVWKTGRERERDGGVWEDRNVLGVLSYVCFSVSVSWRVCVCIRLIRQR